MVAEEGRLSGPDGTRALLEAVRELRRDRELYARRLAGAGVADAAQRVLAEVYAAAAARL